MFWNLCCTLIVGVFQKCCIVAPLILSLCFPCRQSECDFEVQILWSTEISHSPFASAPLITDVNGDGKADIIAAPFTEEVAVIQGEDGKLLQSTRWPHYMSDQSVHSSPLQVRPIKKLFVSSIPTLTSFYSNNPYPKVFSALSTRNLETHTFLTKKIIHNFFTDLPTLFFLDHKSFLGLSTHYQGLSQDLGTGCPEFTIVNFLRCTIFQEETTIY